MLLSFRRGTDFEYSGSRGPAIAAERAYESFGGMNVHQAFTVDNNLCMLNLQIQQEDTFNSAIRTRPRTPDSKYRHPLENTIYNL